MPRPRAMTVRDRQVIYDLLNTIFRHDKHVHDQDVVSDFPLVFADANERNCRVIECDGRAVSHAALFPCELVVRDEPLKTGLIVLVATAAAYRRRGFAADLMRDLQRSMHEEGYDLGILWTGVPAFYRQLGWQTVVPQGWFVPDLRREVSVLNRFRQSDSDVSIERYESRKHLPGIMQLHDREAIRVARSRNDYEVLFRLPKMHVDVMRRSGSVVAYAVIGQAHNKRGLMEYGGAAEDVLAIAAHAVATHPLKKELPLLIHHPYDELARRWIAAGGTTEPLECSKGRGCEMIYPVQPGRLASGVQEQILIWGLDVA